MNMAQKLYPEPVWKVVMLRAQPRPGEAEIQLAGFTETVKNEEKS